MWFFEGIVCFDSFVKKENISSSIGAVAVNILGKNPKSLVKSS